MVKRRGAEIAYHSAIAGGSYYAPRDDAPPRVYSDAWKDRERERLEKLGMGHLAPKDNVPKGREHEARRQEEYGKSEREKRVRASSARVERAMSEMYPRRTT